MKIEEAKRRTIENRKEKELQTERDYIEEWQKHLKASPEFLNNQRVVPDISYTACENTTVSSSSENRIHEHQKDLKGLSQASEINDIMGKSDLINTGAHCPENNIPKEVKNKNTETAHIKKTRTEEYSSNISNKVNSQEFAALGSVSSCLSDKTDQRLTSSLVLPSNACFEAAVAKILPAPRKSISIAVKFSPKTLPNHLPARESREKVQLKESRQTSADTLDVSEREPLFLQDKGDAFYRSGDFRSAINAYTDALAKDSSMVLCYANRAACELQMKEFQSCIDDCTIAIQLLKGRLQEEDGLNTPQCLKNDVACGKGSGNKNGTIKTDLGDTIKMVKDDDTHLKFLVRGSLSLLTLPSIQIYGGENATAAKKWNLSVQSCVLARCGCARCNIGDLDGGASDFAAAFMLDPKNIEIQRTLEEVKQRLESIKSLISH